MRKQSILTILGIFLIFTTLSAQTWFSSKRLTWNSGDSESAAATTDSNSNIHVAWHDDTPGNNEVFYKKSTNGGMAWSGAKRLTWNSSDSEYPAIATDSNDNIHVVWHDDNPGNDEIFYKKSTDGGSTWSSAKRLTWNLGYSQEPAIATDSNNNVHIVWFDSTTGTGDIYYTTSTDGGSTWSAKRLSWNFGYSYLPDITVDSNNNIYVVWADRTGGNYEIYCKKSTNAGTTWGASKRLTWTSGATGTPTVTTDLNNHIFVVFSDQTSGSYRIYFKKSTNGGINWTTQRLSWMTGPSTYPVVAADSNNYIHVVWQDSTYGMDDIYHKRSTNGGSSWTTTRLTWNPNWSYWPDMTIDLLNRIHVVWNYGSTSSREVYYKRGNQ